MYITSTKNPQIKHIKQLQSKSKQRLNENSFVVEGVREVEMALKSNFVFKKVFISKDQYQSNLRFSENTQIIEISSEVYNHIAYRSSTEGILAICESKIHSLENLKLETHNPLIIVVESPEKPGNLGAILRTADAANVDAVIISNPRTDFYNPNTVRSSLGAVFSNQIASAKSEQVIQYLHDHKVNIYAATLQNSNSYLKYDYKRPTAFAMGSEALGLSDIWRNREDIKAINIPMNGEIDSMNLSVSTAILTFEAVRQRANG